MKRKGIILAGGTGSRLWPLTLTVCKQLLPVYDKPMIYYPLTTLMLSGIKDILIITTPQDRDAFKGLLRDGRQWGINISYAVQDKPSGIAHGLLIARDFIRDDPCALILGDNIFFGAGLSQILENACEQYHQTTLFAYWVKDPDRFGVVEVDENKQAKSIYEKPKRPRSNWAVTGLYFYPPHVVQIAEKVKPSERGELEITDVNNVYIDNENANVEMLGRGYAWVDTGTHSALQHASNFINTVEERQGLKIGCPEEVALNKEYITHNEYIELANQLSKSDYGQYLLSSQFV